MKDFWVKDGDTEKLMANSVKNGKHLVDIPVWKKHFFPNEKIDNDGKKSLINKKGIFLHYQEDNPNFFHQGTQRYAIALVRGLTNHSLTEENWCASDRHVITWLNKRPDSYLHQGLAIGYFPNINLTYAEQDWTKAHSGIFLKFEKDTSGKISGFWMLTEDWKSINDSYIRKVFIPVNNAEGKYNANNYYFINADAQTCRSKILK